jgi:hypothetical protein
MKNLLLASTLCAAFLCGTMLLSGCADKMTDRHSAMSGGKQGPPPPGVTDENDKGTPSNTNGTGQPLADGKMNVNPDTMWNQSSPLEGKPF